MEIVYLSTQLVLGLDAWLTFPLKYEQKEQYTTFMSVRQFLILALAMKE